MRLGQSNKVLDMLRWIGFFPVALFAAGLIQFLIGKFYNHFIPIFTGIGPEDFRLKFIAITTTNAVMGAVLVYTGAKIAPFHKVVVSFILAGIAIILSGIFLYPAIMLKDWWSVWGLVCVAIGAGAVIYAIHIGGTDIG